MGEKANRDGAVVRAVDSHHCGPGSIPGIGVLCGLTEFVVGSRPFSEKFFSSYSGFPLSSKPTFPNSNSIRKSEGHWFVSRNRLLSVTLVKQS